MTDIKAAEQQVRETLGWEIKYCAMMGTRAKVWYPGHPAASIMTATADEIKTWDALVSKTAELLEMTAQRDEAQKALEQADKNWQGVFGTQDGQAVIVAKTLENDALLKRAETAEATIREQAEIFRWLLGESGEFRGREDGEGAYWWRTELRKRIEASNER